MSEYPAVLYIEDDANSCEIMHLLLSGEMELDHVTIFRNSANFLAKVETLQPQPDIILLDIHVEPHNGFEMLAMLRNIEAFKHTPVIALTASVMNEEVAKLKTSGFNSVIPKPINQDEFPNILRRILNGESIWRVVY